MSKVEDLGAEDRLDGGDRSGGDGVEMGKDEPFVGARADLVEGAGIDVSSDVDRWTLDVVCSETAEQHQRCGGSSTTSGPVGDRLTAFAWSG